MSNILNTTDVITLNGQQFAKLDDFIILLGNYYRLQEQNKIMKEALGLYANSSRLMITIRDIPEEERRHISQKHIADNGDCAREALKKCEELK